MRGERGAAWVAVLVVLVLVVLGVWLFWTLVGPAEVEGTLRIATGPKGGTYHPVGEGIRAVLAEELPGLTVEVRETAGSVENLKLLDQGVVDLALVQDDTGGVRGVRTLAPLYDEVLHVVSRDWGDTLPNLKDRRVAVGAPGSGTATVARTVLAHYGLGQDTARLVEIGGDEALDAFRKGAVDVVFVLAGLPSDLVARLLQVPDAWLVSLGKPEGPGSKLRGLTRALPGLRPAVVPAHTYGEEPPGGVGTLAVRAVLVGHRRLGEDVVREVTRALFENRADLAEQHIALSRLSEEFDPDSLRYPLHRGARAYLDREEPEFLVEYAEPISLAFTLILAAGSGLLALRGWMRSRKKNRIDVYYVKTDTISERIPHAPREELEEIRAEIHEIRVRAFKDLVEERLAADESFTIFQDFLSSQKRKLEDRLARLKEE